MPEGDSIYRAARLLEKRLVGEEVVSVSGSHRAVAGYGRRLVGRTVERIENHGKHLLIHFSGDWTARCHLKMTGSWNVYRPGQAWTKEEGAARFVLTTPDSVAVCFAAPDVDIKPTPLIVGQIAYLGPDLTADEFDAEEALRRVEGSKASTVSDLLLDQSVMAGVGNVFKSEIAFLLGLNPAGDPLLLTAADREAIVEEARRLLLVNRELPRRVTTGDTRRPYYVYGRNRQGCRRCRSRIRSGNVGNPSRVTYWCPNCQGTP